MIMMCTHDTTGQGQHHHRTIFFSHLTFVTLSDLVACACGHQPMTIDDNNDNDQFALIEKRLNVLATISSAAPFIGLFGTVLGIIRSFQNIGTSGVTSLAAVAPGISEALIATAAGLLAAIPALMAYNHFRNSARKQANDMRDFSMELANRIEWIVHGQLTVARE